MLGDEQTEEGKLSATNAWRHGWAQVGILSTKSAVNGTGDAVESGPAQVYAVGRR